MKTEKNHMEFVGLTHNYYIDYILGGYFSSLKKDNKELNPKEFEKWIKLIFCSPVPPFNPMFLKPLAENKELFANVDLLESQAQKNNYYKVTEFSIENRNTPIKEVENINDVYTKKEIELFSELVEYVNSTKKPSAKEIKKLEQSSYEISSKENFALVSGVFSIATHSNHYWNKEVFEKVWYLDTFGDSQDIFAKGKGGGSVVGADIAGAIVGGIIGAAFGGAGGGLGGLIGGAVVGSGVQAYNNSKEKKKEA